MNTMECKGCLGTVEYSREDHCLHGKLAYVRDLVNYEATTVEDLEAEFQSAVDDYLTTCKASGKAPNVPFKGVFNVRAGPDLRRAAVIAAKDQSLNAFVREAIKEKVERGNT